MLPLALSSAGWAAISAVGGAIVGATAGGVAEYVIARHREGDLARTAARLVAADLKKADDMLRLAESNKKWSGGEDLTTSAWDEHRAVLAGRLDRDQFQAVSWAVSLIRSLETVETEGLSDEVVATTGEARGQLAMAYNAVARLGDLDVVGERIPTWL